MITETVKKMIDETIKDVNWECFELVEWFEKNLQTTKIITPNTLRKIHKTYVTNYFELNNFSDTYIKSKDAKYYLVRGWKKGYIEKTFNLPVFDYRSIDEIISLDALKTMYETSSINEISNKLNVPYGKIKECLKNNNVSLRGIKESTGMKAVVEKRKSTSKERYGVENPSSLNEFKEKRKLTVREKFGVDNVFMSPEIIEKIDNTSFAKYGKKRFTQTVEYAEKTKQSSIKKYGVEHYTQNEEIKEKIKNTNLERYGVECILSCVQFRMKLEKLFLEKYGFKNPSQIDEFKEKRKQTNLERYGKEFYFGTEDYFKKTKVTNLERYGKEFYFGSIDHLEKTTKTNMEKYGCFWPMQNAEVFEKMKKSSFRRTSVESSAGELLHFQGYEYVVYEALLDFFTEQEIETSSKKMPKISYNYKGKDKRYYPDFYIEKLNLFIEVKSNYTYNIDIGLNYAKKNAIETLGFDFELIILERNAVDDETNRRIRDFGNRGD